MFRGLSEEFGLVKEAEQQLLLYNIFISHQLAAFQVGLHFIRNCQKAQIPEFQDFLFRRQGANLTKKLLSCSIFCNEFNWARFVKSRVDTGSGMATWPKRQKPFSIRLVQEFSIRIFCKVFAYFWYIALKKIFGKFHKYVEIIVTTILLSAHPFSETKTMIKQESCGTIETNKSKDYKDTFQYCFVSILWERKPWHIRLWKSRREKEAIQLVLQRDTNDPHEKTNKQIHKSFAARDTRRHQRSAMRCGKVPSSAGVSYTFTYLQVFHSHTLYTSQKLFS